MFLERLRGWRGERDRDGEEKDGRKSERLWRRVFFIYPVLLLFLGSEMRLAKDETKTSIKN